jgi:hypothetical protein
MFGVPRVLGDAIGRRVTAEVEEMYLRDTRFIQSLTW